MDRIAKRRNFIIDVVYVGILLGLFYLFFKYAFGMCLPFIVAVFIATALQKPVNAIMKKTGNRGRSFVSTVLALFCFVVVGTLIALLLIKLFSELKSFFNYLMLKLEDTEAFIAQIVDWINSKLTRLPENLRASVADQVEGFLSKILGSAEQTAEETVARQSSFDLSLLASPISAIWGTAKQIPMVAVGILVAIVSCCFLTSDYASFKRLILKIAGEENSVKIIASKRILFSTVGKLAKAYSLLIMITFAEMLLGLWILKLTGLFSGNYIFAISLVTALVDILPVLGTGTILVPWGLYSLLTGNFGFGVGILVIYVVITVIRQAIEPKLVANQLGLPAYVTIVAMYVGTQLFGFIGLFLMPISIMLLKVLNDEGIINLFNRSTVSVEQLDKEVEAEVSQGTAKSEGEKDN